MFRSVGLFGLGGSKKKVEVSEGIVHDTKQSFDAESKNILDEFEAQFAQGGPVAKKPAPEARIPETMHSARSDDPFADLSSDPFAPPQPSQSRPAPQSNSEDPFSPPSRSQQPSSEQPFAPPKPAPSPAPQRSDAFASPVQRDSAPQPPADLFAPPRSVPEASGPLDPPMSDSRTQRPHTEPQEPFIPLAPARSTPRETPQPSARIPVESLDMDDRDLPDFDFDFHPSGDTATPAPKRSLDFDIPDFSTRNAFEPTLRSERMDDPFVEPSHVESTPEPVETQRRDVIMRGGTLFIEKHALIRHVHDLHDLKGLSSSTHEQFQRIDALAKDEKKILDKMRVEIQTVYDTLEQADSLLFSGE